MKIAYIIPGSGGGFYCQNCLRDNILASGMKDEGHDVVLVPMYLPMFSDSEECGPRKSQVFFGAVSLYLSHRWPALQRMPSFMRRILDSRPVLDMAAKLSSSTRAAGLENLTLDMLDGAGGSFAAENERLALWLAMEKPDIVHISNALLLGTAEYLKKHLAVPIVCSLQDEHQWIDSMDKIFSQKIWHAIAQKAKHVDTFIAVSAYYAAKMEKLLNLPDGTVKIVHIGINTDQYPMRAVTPDVPAVGFLSRISPSLGFGILVDAFLMLKQREEFKDIKLYASGGLTRDNLSFFRECERKISKAGFRKDFVLFKEFDKDSRLDMLRRLSVLSVPVPGGEAFGTYLLEAMAIGVPVVQPKEGGFAEIINITRGGETYSPNTPEILFKTLASLLGNPGRLARLSRQAAENIRKSFDIKKFVANTHQAYRASKSRPIVSSMTTS
ncbi:MAG: glycosyltransferase family 4 protein [Victivallales bacterium]|nr:glycosyltransferase family 4 protein [Victivallales bacterium]